MKTPASQPGVNAPQQKASTAPNSPYRSDAELIDDLLEIETGDPYAPLLSEKRRNH